MNFEQLPPVLIVKYAQDSMVGGIVLSQIVKGERTKMTCQQEHDTMITEYEERSFHHSSLEYIGDIAFQVYCSMSFCISIALIMLKLKRLAKIWLRDHPRKAISTVTTKQDVYEHVLSELLQGSEHCVVASFY